MNVPQAAQQSVDLILEVFDQHCMNPTVKMWMAMNMAIKGVGGMAIPDHLQVSCNNVWDLITRREELRGSTRNLLPVNQDGFFDDQEAMKVDEEVGEQNVHFAIKVNANQQQPQPMDNEQVNEPIDEHAALRYSNERGRRILFGLPGRCSTIITAALGQGNLTH